MGLLSLNLVSRALAFPNSYLGLTILPGNSASSRLVPAIYQLNDARNTAPVASRVFPRREAARTRPILTRTLEQITWQSHHLNHLHCFGPAACNRMMLTFSYTRSTLPTSEEAHLFTAGTRQDLFYQQSALIHSSTVESTSSKSGRFKRRNISVTLTLPGRSIEMAESSASNRLPDEIMSQIIIYALDQAFCNIDMARSTLTLSKPLFARIEGISRSSRRLRAITLSEWFRLFLVKHIDDWTWASRLKGLHSWVRHIVCPPHALEYPVSPNVLKNFPNLRSARLSLSCDYQFNSLQSLADMYPSAPAQLELVPGFTYREPVTAFPPTMTSISIRSTHGSETPLLRALGLHCPDLRALRLNKCTMFECCMGSDSSSNSGTQDPGSSESESEDEYYGQIADGSECPFWGAFPFDHNIYFGDEGVEAYAEELATELQPLKNLEEISLGVYLTPYASLAEHRLSHYPWRHLETSQVAVNTAAPVNSPNLPLGDVHTTAPATTPATTPSCRKAYAESTANAERMAGLILANMLPKLKQIEWASFFETHHSVHSECVSGNEGSAGYRRGTGSHKWRVVRDEAGTLLDLVHAQ
ncbi:hypothetical protein RHS01_01422 [Rhizoctonia solani]|uniref:Uncharacterized protein n=1 Tax=Rhizoctonia solani TaxID=456999 RepID=A0A8H7M8E9_9AGAM|nr:hypothetical protein RHS01_01422 [Rhizoctonia solani]